MHMSSSTTERKQRFKKFHKDWATLRAVLARSPVEAIRSVEAICLVETLARLGSLGGHGGRLEGTEVRGMVAITSVPGINVGATGQ